MTGLHQDQPKESEGAHRPVPANKPAMTCPKPLPTGLPRPMIENAIVRAGSSMKVTPTMPNMDGYVTDAPSPAKARMMQSTMRFCPVSDGELVRTYANASRYDGEDAGRGGTKEEKAFSSM